MMPCSSACLFLAGYCDRLFWFPKVVLSGASMSIHFLNVMCCECCDSNDKDLDETCYSWLLCLQIVVEMIDELADQRATMATKRE